LYLLPYPVELQEITWDERALPSVVTAGPGDFIPSVKKAFISYDGSRHDERACRPHYTDSKPSCYTYDKVKEMVQRQQEKYGWEFLFLGANIDATREAARFGIHADRAANYHADHIGTGVIYESVSAAVSQVHSCPAPLRASWKKQIDLDFKKRK